ncbi:protein of unknown function [Candidatus Nitrosocosmicus franklandus]|uniref:Uncharacterized protein n=1 Tax=Candidatus Nitrosocosmicus franklandianus TaxID=1798806 RepID=A0A484IB71_9ARCH|nr:protein of unknown function [Candidatus Nitrosocosmicus franklandus]
MFITFVNSKKRETPNTPYKKILKKLKEVYGSIINISEKEETANK